MPVWQAAVLLLLAFYLLAKGGSWLVDGAIGMVLVGFATTSPELAVSVLSALSGNPEMALGNAVGSTIVNSGVALALVGLLAGAPTALSRQVFLTAGAFFVLIALVAFVFALNGELSRIEGVLLLGCFLAYLSFLV